jgi:hypothetical protein
MNNYFGGNIEISGGAQLKKNNNDDDYRQIIFTDIYKVCCQDAFDMTNNPAKDLVAAMYHFFKDRDNSLKLLIESQISPDAIATLYLLLQPCKTTKKYIDDSNLQLFIEYFNENAEQAQNDSNYKLKCQYLKYHEITCGETCKKIKSPIKFNENININTLQQHFSKQEFAFEKQNPRSTLSLNEHLAEAEFRIFSSILLKQKNIYSINNLNNYLSYTLDKLKVCDDSNIAHKISLMHIMMISNAYAYVPSSMTEYTNDINEFIKGNINIYKMD